MTIMNKKRILLSALLVVLAVAASVAQGRKELRFNEVMTVNDTSYIDADGHRSAWVEIFNRSYGTVGIEQMFIANREVKKPDNDPRKPKDFLNEYAKQHPDVLYEIPRGDRDTRIAPRTHVVFFADGNTAAGALHLSYALDPAKENTLYLYDVNGDLVDKVTIPANLPANQTWALKVDGKSELTDGQIDANAWETRTGSNNSAVSPAKFNTSDLNDNIEKFHVKDPHGFIITLCAVGIVFSALLLLFILFYLFGKVNAMTQKDTEPAPAETTPDRFAAPAAAGNTTDEEMAAICFALYQHLNAHDKESGVLTFRRDANTAWSSKSSLMRSLPERR